MDASDDVTQPTAAICIGESESTPTGGASAASTDGFFERREQTVSYSPNHGQPTQSHTETKPTTYLLVRLPSSYISFRQYCTFRVINKPTRSSSYSLKVLIIEYSELDTVRTPPPRSD